MAVARKTEEAPKVTPQGGVNRLVPGAEVDIMCSNVMYPGAFIRYVSGAYVEFDSRMGYTVLPWSAISAITFRP